MQTLLKHTKRAKHHRMALLWYKIGPISKSLKRTIQKRLQYPSNRFFNDLNGKGIEKHQIRQNLTLKLIAHSDRTICMWRKPYKGKKSNFSNLTKYGTPKMSIWDISKSHLNKKNKKRQHLQVDHISRLSSSLLHSSEAKP